MGCANTKAGATAYGAPEDAPAEGGDQGSKVDVPKVVVDGEAQEMALNGGVVQNGTDGGDVSREDEENRNGDVSGAAKGSDDTPGKEDVQKSSDPTASSGEEKSNENVNGCADGGGKDGGEKDEAAHAECGKEGEAAGKDAQGDGVPVESGDDAASESRESNQDGGLDIAE